ncbi:hypothetical protein ERTO105960_01985 [Erysipelothrix tonsillarum]
MIINAIKVGACYNVINKEGYIMKKLFKVAVGAAAVMGVGLVVKKIIEKDVIQDKVKEREAMNYLKDKYGEEALNGKKIMIINNDEPVTKTDIAKDIVEYEMQN